MADNTTLKGRACSLVVGSPNDPNLNVSVNFNASNSIGLDVSGFDFAFEVTKTLKPEPNTCSIQVYNLSEVSRKKLSGGKKLTVSLNAGYVDGSSLLYLGEVRAAWTQRDGSDFVTHIESGDGEAAIQTARLQVTRGAKVPVDAALNAIVQALQVAGVGGGNAAQVAATIAGKGLGAINGSALTGSAAKRMTDICRSAGLEWSIQNGNLQILNIGQVLSTTRSILMSSDAGMINSPSVDNKGIVTAQCLLIPNLIPGVLINFQSLFVNGGYRVERCRYVGQIFGTDWQCEFECRKY
jgi:hypothetical protein